MPLRDLKDLFIHELRDLYAAEKQLLSALPSLAECARHEDLRATLECQSRQRVQHISRLDKIFEQLGVRVNGTESCGMRGLLQHADEILAEEAEDAVRDAALIAAAQRIEHYEIAAYSSARAFADRLGMEDFAWTLTQSLEDEREVDEKLTDLAAEAVNLEAAEAPEVG